MFKDIGSKLKRASEIVCWSGITLSVLYAMALSFNSFDNFLFPGLGIGVMGSLASWVAGLLLYGFGELIENTAAIKNKLCGTVPPSFAENRDAVAPPEFAADKKKYSCRSIIVSGEYSRGQCPVCKRGDMDLALCKIHADIGMRDLSICSDCADSFKYNAAE